MAIGDAGPDATFLSSAGKPSTSAVLVWNFADPIHPETVLESPFEVFAFKFNPYNTEVVVGGCVNGQVVLWDMRQEAGRPQVRGDGKSPPMARHLLLSDVDASHSKSITDLEWLPWIEIARDGSVHHVEDPKHCHIFATTGADGSLLFWDSRWENIAKPKRRDDGIVWSPLLRINLPSESGGALTATRLNFSTRERPLPAAFYAASNEGEVVAGEFSLDRSSKDKTDFVQSHLHPHSSAVVCLERSPFFPQMILAAGDWSFTILREGIDEPVFYSPMSSSYYTAGCWSPSRPGVLYLARQDGVLEVWDMMERSHEPAMTTTVSSTALRCMAFQMHPGGQSTSASTHFLAVGDDAGVLHVMELPRNLRRAPQTEKKAMEAFWGREVARTQALIDRSKKRGEGAPGAGGEGDAGGAVSAPIARPSAPPPPGTGGSRVGEPMVDEKAEAEYKKLEAQLMLELGLVATEAD